MSRARLGRVFPLEEAIRLYRTGLSLVEVAKALGYTKSAAQAHFNKIGFKMRPRGGKRFGKRKSYTRVAKPLLAPLRPPVCGASSECHSHPAPSAEWGR